MKSQSIVLNHSQIQQKTERMALEILESTFEQTQIFIGGIAGNGFVFAQRLLKELQKISDQTIILFKIEINKTDPLDNIIRYSISKDQLTDATVILVDDVINSGRTLIHAVRALLDNKLRALKVATLVNRTHRRFPVQADFVGINISTTLQDNILVEFGENEIAYLE